MKVWTGFIWLRSGSNRRNLSKQ